MTTVASGTTQTFVATSRGQTFTITKNAGSFVDISGDAGTYSLPTSPRRRTFGPLEQGQTITVAAVNGDVIVEFGNATVSNQGGSGVAFQAPLVPIPNTVVVFGDSLTTYNNIFFTPTTMSRTNGVATMVVASGHTLAQDGRMRLYNVLGPGANSDHSFDVADVAVTYVSNTTITYPNAGPDVANFTPNATYARAVQKSGLSNVSLFAYANSYLKCPLKLADNLGRSSETTVDMVWGPRLQELASSTAAMAWVLAGSNDAANTAIPVATTTANLLTIWKTAIAAGKMVVACTIPPVASAYPTFAATSKKIAQINAWIKQAARTLPGVVLADLYSVMVDKAQTDGRAIANMLQPADSIHWQVYGARTAGREIGRVLSPITPPGNSLITTALDYRTNDTLYQNVWLGVPWTTSGGTLSGGVTGTAAAGCNVAMNNASGSATAVASVVADPDGYGQAQRVVFTPGGAADTCTIQQQTAATAAAFMTAGEQYVQRYHVSVTGVTGSSLSYLRSRNQVIVNGVTMAIGTPLNSSVAGANNVFADIDDIFESPPMIVPSGGAITSYTAEIIMAASGAGSALTATVSRHTHDRAQA